MAALSSSHVASRSGSSPQATPRARITCSAWRASSASRLRGMRVRRRRAARSALACTVATAREASVHGPRGRRGRQRSPRREAIGPGEAPGGQHGVGLTPGETVNQPAAIRALAHVERRGMVGGVCRAGVIPGGERGHAGASSSARIRSRMQSARCTAWRHAGQASVRYRHSISSAWACCSRASSVSVSGRRGAPQCGQSWCAWGA